MKIDHGVNIAREGIGAERPKLTNLMPAPLGCLTGSEDGSFQFHRSQVLTFARFAYLAYKNKTKHENENRWLQYFHLCWKFRNQIFVCIFILYLFAE